jgi:hypothetical protein
MQLISFSSGKPEFVGPKIGGLTVRAHLMEAPEGALIPASRLGLAAGCGPAPAAEEIGAVKDNLRMIQEMAGGEGGSSTPSFDDADMDELEAAFRAFEKKPKEAAYQRYLASLRRHYILDSEMAEQADYFLRYADAVIRHVRNVPSLKGTGAILYLQYLAQDLQDTGDERLAAKGQVLAGLL